VPSIAADLVTTSDIANGAVTQPKLAADSVVGGKIANESVAGTDIKNGTVGNADLADAAKGAKVIRYDLGAHNFGTLWFLARQLPGTWDGDVVMSSSWSAGMYAVGEGYYAVPGPGAGGGQIDYRLKILDNGVVRIESTGTGGEDYLHIYLYRTVSTSTLDTTPAA